MTTAHDVLVRADELAGEFNICTGAIAVDEGGNAVGVLHPHATGFCSLGLITRARIDLSTCLTDDQVEEQAIIHFKEVNGIPSDMALSMWNDHIAADPDVIRAAFRKAAGRQTANTGAIEAVHRYGDALEVLATV